MVTVVVGSCRSNCCRSDRVSGQFSSLRFSSAALADSYRAPSFHLLIRPSPRIFLQVAIFLIFATGFLMASWLLFIIAEKANKAKHIQFVSGVNVFVFWLASFAWDMLTVIAPTLGVLIVFAAFNTEAYSGDGRLGIVLFLFLLLGWAGIPMMYTISRLFSTPSGGYAGEKRHTFCLP